MNSINFTPQKICVELESESADLTNKKKNNNKL